MGARWQTQDHHPRRRQQRKVTLAGRLTATTDGRPVFIDAQGDEFIVRPGDLRTAWLSRRSWPALRSVLGAPPRSAVPRIRIDLNRWGTHELHPHPPGWMRFLLRV